MKYFVLLLLALALPFMAIVSADDPNACYEELVSETEWEWKQG